MKTAFLVCMVTMLVSLDGCTSKSTNPPSVQDWCLWIGSDKDTYVWMEYPQSNWKQQGYLAVAYLGDHKRSFVHFLMPNLPEGTIITRAYLELYHGGQNEDGYSDEIDMQVQRASASWSVATLTWATQPTFSRQTEFYLHLRSKNWCGSDEIQDVVTEMIVHPENDFGFIVDYYDPALTHGIDKGLHSNNLDRTAADMKTAPRLLMKIRLPAGRTFSEITLPPLSSDNDLGFAPGTEILMMRYAPGSDWPDEWSVIADI